MSVTLTVPQVSGSLTATLASTAGKNSSNTTKIDNSTATSLTVGSSAGQVNKVYDATITIASSGSPATIDLTAAPDPQGNAQNFAVVNAIKLTGVSVTPGEDITPFGGTNGLFATGTQKVIAGTTPGSLTLDFGTTGVTVDGTHKIITLTSAAGTNVQVYVSILGR
jgi:hypothetical protein